MFLAAVVHVRERGRGLQPLAAAGSTEAPELSSSALVAVDEVIELEFIELAGIELGEPVANVLEQRPKLFLVVGADDRTRLPSLRLLARSTSRLVCLGHGFRTYLRDERSRSRRVDLLNWPVPCIGM